MGCGARFAGKELCDRKEYRVLTVDVTYTIARKAVDTSGDAQWVLTVCGASRTLVVAHLCDGESNLEFVGLLMVIIPDHAKSSVEFVCQNKVNWRP